MRNLSLILILVFAVAACSTNLGLKRTAIEDITQTEGLVDLYLYGRGSLSDPIKVAIIDKASDDYAFHILASAKQFDLVPGIDLKRAVEIAEEFVGGKGTCTDSISTSSILGENGAILGYELRAIYNSPLTGNRDPVLTSYWVREQGDVGVNITVTDLNFGSVHCSRS